MATQKTFINDLTEGSVARKLLYFAFPFMLSNLLQTVYNLVDMSVVGHFMGSAGLSAVSTGGRLVDLLTFVCTGFCTGGQILLSQQVGAKKHEEMQKTIGTLFSFTMLSAIVLGVLSIVLHNNLLRLLNTKNVYLVPLRQDDPVKKPRSLVADFSQIPRTIAAALSGVQMQPMLSYGAEGEAPTLH